MLTMSLSDLPPQKLVNRIEQTENNECTKMLLYEELWYQYQPAINSRIKTMLQNGFPGIDPGSVEQDVAIKMWDRLNQYEGKSSFWGWLRTITTNCTIDAIRRESSRRTLFKVDAERSITDELNEGFLPNEILKMFRLHGIRLSEGSLVEKRSEAWVVRDEQKTYIIIPEYSELRICRIRTTHRVVSLDRPYTSGHYVLKTTPVEKEVIKTDMKEILWDKAMRIKAQRGNERSARIIKMRYRDERSVSLIAKQIDIGEGTVRNDITENIPSLKGILQRDFGVKDINQI